MAKNTTQKENKQKNNLNKILVPAALIIVLLLHAHLFGQNPHYFKSCWFLPILGKMSSVRKIGVFARSCKKLIKMLDEKLPSEKYNLSEVIFDEHALLTKDNAGIIEYFNVIISNTKVVFVRPSLFTWSLELNLQFQNFFWKNAFYSKNVIHDKIFYDSSVLNWNILILKIVKFFQSFQFFPVERVSSLESHCTMYNVYFLLLLSYCYHFFSWFCKVGTLHSFILDTIQTTKNQNIYKS